MYILSEIKFFKICINQSTPTTLDTHILIMITIIIGIVEASAISEPLSRLITSSIIGDYRTITHHIVPPKGIHIITTRETKLLTYCLQDRK